jgi:TRAP-type C4-dicarboxylate transport system substrate-binding protein
MNHRGCIAALFLLGAFVATGCTSGAGGGDKAGGGGEPVVLKLAEGGSWINNDLAVADFVRRVGELSGGALRIEVPSDGGIPEPHAEQQTVRDVQAGKFDLGSVGTRVFDTLDVDSFQALTAPMLIDSYPLERAVISSQIPAQMLDGLDTAGVIGLGVLADGLRRPIAVRQPLLSPSDWRGITFAAVRSQGQAESVQALGALPSELNGAALTEALQNGQVQGAENNLLGYETNRRETAAPYITANVILWPKMIALLANPGRFSRLSAEQQGWLRRAARETASASTSLFEREDGIVATVCASGGRFANASQADVAALEQAFAPVYITLEKDPETKEFISQIEQLKQSISAGPPLAIPPGCTGSVSGGGNTNDPIAGRWSTGKLTESQVVRAFVAAGGSEKDGHALFAQLGGGSKHYAVITLQFQDGLFTKFESGDGRPPIREGPQRYEIAKDGTFTLDDAGCLGTYRYQVSSDTLRLYSVKQCNAVDGPYWASSIAGFSMTRSS